MHKEIKLSLNVTPRLQASSNIKTFVFKQSNHQNQTFKPKHYFAFP